MWGYLVLELYCTWRTLANKLFQKYKRNATVQVSSLILHILLFSHRRKPGAWGYPSVIFCDQTAGAISSRQAEALHRRCLAAREVTLGAHHPHTLFSMNGLAMLLGEQGKMKEAEPMAFGAHTASEILGPFFV